MQAAQYFLEGHLSAGHICIKLHNFSGRQLCLPGSWCPDTHSVFLTWKRRDALGLSAWQGDVVAAQGVLPNQTWVCSPTCSKAGLLTGCGEGKYSIYSRCQARGPGSQCLKDPNSPKAFGERFIKTRGGKGFCVYVCVSSWTFFCLVGGEVITNHLVPTSLGSVWLVGRIQLIPSTWLWSKQLKGYSPEY